jgi:DNA-binding MarR family transcriptional regulator
MAEGVRAVATAVERDSRAFFTLSMQAMEGGDPLRPSALRALLALEDRGPLTVAGLAEDLALSQSATSRLVDRLVQQGLVDRAADPSDRRQLEVRPTAAGASVVQRLVGRRRSAVLRVLAVMDDDDRAALQQGLTAFAVAARRR